VIAKVSCEGRVESRKWGESLAGEPAFDLFVFL
jgi:hypothetical protein